MTSFSISVMAKRICPEILGIYPNRDHMEADIGPDTPFTLMV